MEELDKWVVADFKDEKTRLGRNLKEHGTYFAFRAPKFSLSFPRILQEILENDPQHKTLHP